MLKSSPSKFGAGVSLLWRGNQISLLNRFLRSLLFRTADDLTANLERGFLFESARSAIYNCLVSQGVGGGDEVIISSFTCEAVTYAVLRTGACPVYVDVHDDLTMCDEEVLSAVRSSTRAVIVQNTFGRLGLQPQTLEQLRQQGLFIIEDCALAIGSELDGVPLGSFGNVSVWSLEVSKTVTIGWGGVAQSNDPYSTKLLAARYGELGSVSSAADFRRLFQLWFSVLMTRFPIPGGSLVWYFMYGTRVFRRSNSFANQHPTKYEKMGVFSAMMFGFMEPRLAEIFRTANRNYLVLQREAERLGLNCPIVQADSELIVAPRFSVCLPQDRIDGLLSYSNSIGVEIGCWFSECPPDWGRGFCRIYGSENAERISSTIVNLPCHWTLEADELEKVKTVLSYMAVVK